MQGLIEELQRLSSAEDFLIYFGIAFDEKVVNVSRLHILKRFFQYIKKHENSSGDKDTTAFAVYQSLLLRAYNDFVVSVPAEQKLFKVLQSIDGRQHVSVDKLRASLPTRGTA
ncbi:nitrogenase stabilizing/protective protein NifW [Cupriavidus consociatus]|uniref:nitrogenase stabilizing/protective protein NifW n=1 Tax=Cupriavidus consociatus TaxID=2821357 RepID=UPI001AE7BF97|nr:MULTISPECIES: nitrogenase stabilizing/protective protein NifW [unclassified Cupriavidus]MBP0625262.1 nitrogenase stabilizing/protective protein NifW [Cupriavidus sp. LEh25]MDK2661996.1 nitrogenase stabilizing/protective protein NifW [Cupriavidus sp. LEh21]